VTSPDFETFWRLWPRKTAKVAAIKAWRKIPPLELPLVMEGLTAQLPELNRRESVYCPYPATWLNGLRWRDEPPTPTVSPITAKMLPQSGLTARTATNAINRLIASGIAPDEAKDRVYRQLGWIQG